MADSTILPDRLYPTMLQRVHTPTRLPRSAPHGFIRLCAPTIFDRALREPRWTHEIKRDGYRFCCRKNGDAPPLAIVGCLALISAAFECCLPT